MDFALAQAWLYRSRGELKAARRYLNDALAADKRPRIICSTLSGQLGQGWNRTISAPPPSGWVKPGMMEKSMVGRVLGRFLLGEICRRTGDLGGAKHCTSKRCK